MILRSHSTKFFPFFQMPVAVLPDEHVSSSPDSSVVAGYADCLKEALKFLLEREKLSPQHPVVAGLAMHLARPGARQSLRRLASSHKQPSRRTHEVAHRRDASRSTSSSERNLHTVRNTCAIGRSRFTNAQIRQRQTHAAISDVKKEVEEERYHSDHPVRDQSPSVSSNTNDESQSNSTPSSSSSSKREINRQLRKNLQNIVNNLQDAIDNNISDEDSSYEDSEDEDEGSDPIYDVDENDLDTEIETILGDAELRRELVRLVYQGCDLVAVAPQQSFVYPSPPCSPQYATVATPQYLPDEHIIQHLPNDRL